MQINGKTGAFDEYFRSKMTIGSEKSAYHLLLSKPTLEIKIKSLKQTIITYLSKHLTYNQPIKNRSKSRKVITFYCKWKSGLSIWSYFSLYDIRWKSVSLPIYLA